MASKAVANVAGGVKSISQKQTLQSTGIWERLRRTLAVDPNRSNGVPLNPWYRNPTPGSIDPLKYDDPVTTPAGDIADNPYWKRDARRSYSRQSVIGQADAVALLSVGSAAAPKQELIGEAGSKALVAAQEEGKSAGLAAFLGREVAGKDLAEKGKALLTRNGLPPLPAGQEVQADGKWTVHGYERTEDAYSEDYPCRSFR